MYPTFLHFEIEAGKTASPEVQVKHLMACIKAKTIEIKDLTTELETQRLNFRLKEIQLDKTIEQLELALIRRRTQAPPAPVPYRKPSLWSRFLSYFKYRFAADVSHL